MQSGVTPAKQVSIGSGGHYRERSGLTHALGASPALRAVELAATVGDPWDVASAPDLPAPPFLVDDNGELLVLVDDDDAS